MRPDQSKLTESTMLHHKHCERRVEVGLLRQLLMGPNKEGRNRMLDMFCMNKVQRTEAEPVLKTDHINVSDHLLEVWVCLVALNLLRLQLSSSTLHLHQGALHLEQMHTLQLPQAPEQHLKTQIQKELRQSCVCVYVLVYICLSEERDLNSEGLQNRSDSIRDDVKLLLLHVGQLLRVHTAGETGLQTTGDC